jgi:hypothetical protein
MHTEEFYPHRLHRKWSVTDGAVCGVRADSKGRPHSLWVFKADADEMRWRLDEQCEEVPAYGLLGLQSEELRPRDALQDMRQVIADIEALWTAMVGMSGHGEVRLALGEALRALRKARLLGHILAIPPRKELEQ